MFSVPSQDMSQEFKLSLRQKLWQRFDIFAPLTALLHLQQHWLPEDFSSFELFLSINVVFILINILRPYSWNVSNIWVVWSVPSIVSSPYNISLLMIALCTCIIHLALQPFWFHNISSDLRIGVVAVILDSVSLLASSFSLIVAPRYVVAYVVFTWCPVLEITL